MDNHRGNAKKRIVTSIEEDRISNLPEHLIDSILEGLPIEDAVRTSIISKKWRHTWTKMRPLVFDEQFFKKFTKNGAFGRNGFIRIINKVLILHNGPISKFLIHIPNMYLDRFEEVDQWMLLLSRNGVRELTITSSKQCYELPSYVFSCQELITLQLENCFFKPPLEFEGFINLEELSLEDIDFTANLCGTQINLPQLKEFSMYRCTNAYNFTIKATKLEVLAVLNCPDAMFLHLFHSPCLTEVGIFFQDPIKDFVRVERITLTMMFSSLQKIEKLLLDGAFFKVLIAENIPKWLPHAVNTLKSLSFVNFELGDVTQLHGALCLLRNSPNLESLSLEMEPQVMHYDVGPASNHLESPNCLDFTLNRLQTMEISSLEGSKPELLFIKLLLAHAPSLEKCCITPSIASNVQKRLDIAMNVMEFPRASTKAKMFYLKP